METIPINCANCGAPLTVPDGATVVTCQHCRAKLGITYPEPPADMPPRRGEATSGRPRTSPGDSQDPAELRPTSQVLEVVRAGVQAVDAGVSVVNTVSGFVFWAKMTVILIVVIFVFGGCVVPSFFAFKLLGGKLLDSEPDRVAEQPPVAPESPQRLAPADNRADRPAVAKFEVAVPSDAAQAHEFLLRNDYAHRAGSVEWLAQAPVSPDQQLRAAIARELLAELEEQQLQAQATVALSRWLPAEPGPVLTEAARDLPAASSVTGDFLLRMCWDRSHVESLVALMNHPHNELREQARSAAQHLNASSPMLLQQCLRDVRSEERWAIALAELKSMKLDAAAKTKFIAALDTVANFQMTPQNGEDLAEVLAMCFPDSIPQAVHLMAKPQLRPAVAASLKRAGPVAEKFLWPALDGSDRLLNIAACEVLAKIGTQQSLSHLKQLAEQSDPGRRGAARAAISAIVAANRRPVDF